MAVYVTGDNMNYSDTSEVEYISEEIRKFVSNKNIITNTYSIQACNSIMCGYNRFHVKR